MRKSKSIVVAVVGVGIVSVGALCVALALANNYLTAKVIINAGAAFSNAAQAVELRSAIYKLLTGGAVSYFTQAQVYQLGLGGLAVMYVGAQITAGAISEEYGFSKMLHKSYWRTYH